MANIDIDINRHNREVNLLELAREISSSKTATVEDKQSLLLSINAFDPDPIKNQLLFQVKVGLLRSRNPEEAFVFAQRFEEAHTMEFIVGVINIGTADLLGIGYYHRGQYSKSKAFLKICETLTTGNQRDQYRKMIRVCDSLLEAEASSSASGEASSSNSGEASYATAIVDVGPVSDEQNVEETVIGGASSNSGEASYATAIVQESDVGPVSDEQNVEEIVTETVGAPIDEPESASQRIGFDISFDVEIIETFKDGSFSAIVKNSSGKCRRTFIKSTPHQTLEALQSLREGSEENQANNYIVLVDSMVEYQGSKFLICAEDVVPLDHYFQSKCDEFLSNANNRNDRRRWWDDIEDCFTKISRHVMRGLRLMYEFSRLHCGGLKNSIYVTKFGQGRILPNLDPQAKLGGDIYSLKKKLRSIIGLPFGEASPKFGSYGIPKELIHFMNFVVPEKAKHVPAQWLLDHPWIWIPVERVNFIKKMKILIDSRLINKYHLNVAVSQAKIYGTSDPAVWPNFIDAGVFLEIYNFSQSQQVSEYLFPVDILRYMNAAYKHVNESRYANCPDRIKKMYTSLEVEERLRGFFPDVYIIMYESVYHYEKDWRRTIKFDDEVFRGLASEILTHY